MDTIKTEIKKLKLNRLTIDRFNEIKDTAPDNEIYIIKTKDGGVLTVLATLEYINELLKESVAKVYKFKGSVPTYDDLPPAEDNENGDVWDVQEDGKNYAWVVEDPDTKAGHWDDIGGIGLPDNVYTADNLIAGENVSFDPESGESGVTVLNVHIPEVPDNVWTQENLISSEHIQLSRIQKPIIDEKTAALFHFNDSLDNLALSYDNPESIAEDYNIYATTPKSYQAAKFGNGAYWEIGRNNYQFVPLIKATTALPIGTTSFYIECWFRINGGPGDTIYDGMLFFDNMKFYMPGRSGNQNNINFLFGTSSGGTKIMITDLSSTEMHHLAIERKGDKFYIYHNGQVVYSETNFTRDFGTPTNILSCVNNHITVDEFLIELGDSKHHNGIAFDPFDEEYELPDSDPQYEPKLLIDDHLSDTSTHPVQNKVLKEILDNKVESDVAYTTDTLLAGNNIDIRLVDTPLIDSYTAGLWHFNNSSTFPVDEINEMNLTSSWGSSQVAYTSSVKKFGEGALLMGGMNGNNIYINTNTSELPSFGGTEGYSVDCWINFNTVPAIHFCLGTASSSSATYYSFLNVNITSAGVVSIDERANVSDYGKTTIISKDTGFELADGSFHHIAIGYNSTSKLIAVFIDGNKACSINLSKFATGFKGFTVSWDQQRSMYMDELRISTIDRYTQYINTGFEPFNLPYSHDGISQYKIHALIPTDLVHSDDVHSILPVTQAEYDEMAEESGESGLDDNTLYLITDAPAPTPGGGGAPTLIRKKYSDLTVDGTTLALGSSVDLSSATLIKVYVNGLLLEETPVGALESSDYTIDLANNSIIFTSAITDTNAKVAVEVF